MFEKIKKFFSVVKQKLKNLKPPKFFQRLQEKPGYDRFMAFTQKYSLLFDILISFITCFAVEWICRRSFMGAVSFVSNHTAAYLYNTFIIFIVMTLVYIGRKRIGHRMLVCGGFVILSAVNGIILTNRVTPFGFTDLYMILDLVSMKGTNYFTKQQAAIAFTLVGIFVVFLIYETLVERKQNVRFKLPFRLLFIGLAMATVPMVTGILQKTGVMASYFGNLAQGYLDYGYIYGFGMSVFDRGMSKPDGYNKDTIDSIIARTEMGESELDAEDGPNVIVVLLESFYDPYETDFLKMDADPIPYFRELQRQYSSGYLEVPVVGAGTCNSEFEVLTGMSCQFLGPGEYPQKTILKKRECESFADDLKNLGYGAHVTHNNGGNFYSRKNAFAKMGFDTFTSKEMLDINELTPLGTWPRDGILVEATRDALDSTPGKDFIYTISVETHGNYPKYKVLNPPDINVETVGRSEEERCQWEYYINMLHREDDFIRQFISMLESRGEPTMVIMFGDHLPTLGLESHEQKSGSLFNTNYITWNNLGMRKQDANLTSYQLVPEYLDRLGIHGGTILDYHQYCFAQNIASGTEEYMGDLDLLQYDILYGKRYAYDGQVRYPETDIEMGVKDIVIDRIYVFKDKLHIYGQNFTSWSKVFIDGTQVKTHYLSGQVLAVDMEYVKEGKPIQVNQMGSGKTIFRSSNEVEYRSS